MSTSGRAEQEGGAALAQPAIANSLEQVRELLFGPQYREIVRRMARIDAHLTAQSDELRNEMRRRLEALEQHVNKEVEALSASLTSQRTDQIEALNSALRESRETVGLLEQRVKKLEETTARAQRDFRQQLLDQAKSFIDEVRRMRDELGATMERQLAAARGEGDFPEPASEGPAQREPWERPSEAA